MPPYSYRVERPCVEVLYFQQRRPAARIACNVDHGSPVGAVTSGTGAPLTIGSRLLRAYLYPDHAHTRALGRTNRRCSA